MSVSLPTAYVLVPGVTAVLAVVLASTAWSRRPAPGTVPLTGVFLAVGLWAGAYTVELLHTDAAGTLLWGKLAYFGIVLLPAAWFLFAVDYTGTDDWRSIPLLAGLAIEPLVVLALVWSYPGVVLVWADTIPHAFGDIVVLTYRYGPVFWIHTAYTYGLIAIGAWIVARTSMQTPTWSRTRAGAILLTAVFPGVANVLFTVGIRPTPPLNITHLGFVVSGAVFVWVFYRGQLLDPRRSVRERVFDVTETGVILLDRDNEIVDLNPAAETIVTGTRSEVLGQPLNAVLPVETPVFTEAGGSLYAEEITVPGNDGPRRYAVDVSSLYYTHQQRVMGRIVYLRGQ